MVNGFTLMTAASVIQDDMIIEDTTPNFIILNFLDINYNLFGNFRFLSYNKDNILSRAFTAYVTKY